MMVSFTVAAAAFLSTGLISLAPNVFLLLFPRYAEGEGGSSKILSLGQAMSAGSLLGDVLLHTLPHHVGSTPDCGIWVLMGFTLFLTVDMLLRWLDPHSHSHTNHNHGGEAALNGTTGTSDITKPAPPNIHQSVVFLNLAADALHNFTDGLAIGASYAMYDNSSNDDATVTLVTLLQSRGGLASISILLHEVPHELGDFCTLVKAGYSKSQAVMAQFGTAVAAFMGTALALTVSQGDWAGERLLFVTAGGFVYLAATTLLPEVLDHGDTTLFYRLLQLAFFVAGIGFLYMVAHLEEQGNHQHATHHHHQHHQEL